MKKWIPYFFISASLASCNNDPNAIKKFADPENIYIEVSEDIRLLHKEQGYTSAIITAPILNRYTKNENKSTFPKGLQIELYQNDLMTAIIQAGYGERDESSKIMKASGGVTIINYKQEKMESEDLIWNESLNKINIEGQVKVTTPTDIIQGFGLESDDKFNNYKMSKITGILKVEGNNIPGN
ncbi:MAG TPA: LPS export ABC transporter periplasmic protein LptC [Chitinophagales bacterium]|nr:LPS export ABC transporter periplasmic protein LptC [Chitinophagales bacterium]